MREPVKIHPVIASDIESDEPNEIPICFRLNCHSNDYRAIPKPEGTLQDLRNFICQLFTKTRQDSNGQIVFELDLDTKKYVGRTLDQLIDECDFLTKYDQIVICCPLHYLASKAYQEEDSRIIKLIYRIESDELVNYPKLQALYHNHLDYLKQETLRFYEDVRSVSLQWVELAKQAFLEGIPHRTQNTLETDNPTY